MKAIIFNTLMIALIAVFMTNDFKITITPFKIGVERFNWVLSIGLFLVLLGFFLSCGYCKHLGKKDSGYWKGYEAGIEATIEFVENKNSSKQ